MRLDNIGRVPHRASHVPAGRPRDFRSAPAAAVGVPEDPGKDQLGPKGLARAFRKLNRESRSMLASRPLLVGVR